MRENLANVRLRVGRNIRHLRRLRGWSLEQLAERMGMTEKHVGEVERGKINVPLDLLTTVAEIFAVDVVELFSGTANNSADAPTHAMITPQDFERIDEVAQIFVRLRRARAARSK